MAGPTRPQQPAEARLHVRVLGPVELQDEHGRPVPVVGERQRALLAVLVARAGAVVSAGTLTDLLWADAERPAHPSAALQNHVSRLRRALAGAGVDADDALRTRPPGYALALRSDQVDATRFEQLVAQARRTTDAAAALALLDEALGLWRGEAYGELAELDVVRLEHLRLEDLRLGALEQRGRALVDTGQPAEATAVLEPLVADHPLREGAQEALMRALYHSGRHSEAVQRYADYRAHLADELGLEPTASLQQLAVDVLRHELRPAGSPHDLAPSRPPVGGLQGLQVRYARRDDGHRVAWATTGTGEPLVALPAWVTSLEVMASGRDPRSSLLERLSRGRQLVLYDRLGTGLSRGPVADYGLEPAVAELGAVVAQVGRPVALLAGSQAGPTAVAFAARHPALVRALVLLGTYADGPTTFPNSAVQRTVVEMVRAHWGLGSVLLAGLYRPGASDAVAGHLARVLRDSADQDVAAGYLEACYPIDVTALLPDVSAPTLVLHYRDDRVVPFAGGRQLAAGIAGARLLALDGGYHLPDAADLDEIVSAVDDFLATATRDSSVPAG